MTLIDLDEETMALWTEEFIHHLLQVTHHDAELRRKVLLCFGFEEHTDG